MKFAVISDVHGNLEALEAVLRDIEKQGAEKIFFLGDVVGYGCNPNQCVKKIDKYCEIKLLGNHDYALMGLESTDCFNKAAQKSMIWTQDNVKGKTIETLSDFELTGQYLDFFMVHASPGYPDNWRYILSMESAAVSFEEFTTSVCFIGHSHIPTTYILNKDGDLSQNFKPTVKLDPNDRYIINVGSVGQPRDNDSRACYLLVDNEKMSCTYRRVDYDVLKTQEKMRKANLPSFLIDRLSMGV